MLYKNYDQAALDLQFNVRIHTPEFADYFEKWDRLSRQTENTLSCKKDIPYGELPLEQSDIYPSSIPHSKVLVFIHGGYWQSLDKSSFHFIAETFNSDNVTTVLINYPLAPAYSMDQIVLSCRKAVAWIYHNIENYNGNPHEIYVAGHSAGGHLAAMMMTADWNLIDNKLPAQLIQGVTALSGLFNLVPVQLCYQNHVVNMDKETAMRNSPDKLVPVVNCPLILAVGGAETDEFIDQSRELEMNWKKYNDQIQLLQVAGRNHYSIMDEIISNNTSLVAAIRQMMKLVK